MRKLIAGAAVAVTALVGAAGPAAAHFCINESKSAINPYAGAKGAVVITEDGETEISLMNPNAKGAAKGGFFVVDLSAFDSGIWSIFLPGGPEGVLPDGARLSGPGGETIELENCDGVGVGELFGCLAFLLEEGEE